MTNKWGTFARTCLEVEGWTRTRKPLPCSLCLPLILCMGVSKAAGLRAGVGVGRRGEAAGWGWGAQEGPLAPVAPGGRGLGNDAHAGAAAAHVAAAGGAEAASAAAVAEAAPGHAEATAAAVA